MTRVRQSNIDEIVSSLDIVDVISQYTPLRKAGKNFMGRCPFHEERTPSFSVSQEKGVYHCFGCGKSGNIFTFVMDVDKVSFYEAVKTLADKANVKLEYEKTAYDDEESNKIEVLYEINRRAGKFFYENLTGRDGAFAREYLDQRGIRDVTLKKFGLGFSLRERDSLYRNLSDEFSKDDLTASGLVLALNMNEVRDRFRGRLMFPIFSESGRVVGFGGRKLFDEDHETAKYINSPETRIYNKSKTLYGLNFARNRIKESGFAILVEGYMDLISLFQAGFENVIASSGTSLTGLQVKILSRYTKEVAVVYDADSAGQSASRRAIEILIENDINTNIVVLPQGEDPDSYLKDQGKEKFAGLLKKRSSVIDYIGKGYEAAGRFSTPEGKTEFVREIISLVAKMKDPIKRDLYIKDVAEKFSVYESIIRGELQKYLKLKSKGFTREARYVPEEKKITPQREMPASNVELTLIRLLVDSNDETKDFLLENLDIDYIGNPDVARIVNHILMAAGKKTSIKHATLFNVFTDDSSRDILGKALLDENYVMQENRGRDNVTEARALIIQFRISHINSELREIENKIKSSNKYSPEVLELQKSLQKLIDERISLKKEMKNLQQALS